MTRVKSRLASTLLAFAALALSMIVTQEGRAQADILDPEAMQSLQRMTDYLGGLKQFSTQALAVGLGEVDMLEIWATAIEVGVFSTPCIVNHLVRQQNPPRRERIQDAPDCVDAHDKLYTQLLQGPHVGAVVDPVRRDAVWNAMTREKKQSRTAVVTFHDGVGTVAPGGLHPVLGDCMHTLEPIQSGTADQCHLSQNSAPKLFPATYTFLSFIR